MSLTLSELSALHFEHRLNLEICRYLCLDEAAPADRVQRTPRPCTLSCIILSVCVPALSYCTCMQVDLVFEDDLRQIIRYQAGIQKLSNI